MSTQREVDDESPWKDPDVLYQLYHEQGLSTREIGEMFDLSRGTIRYHMEMNGIDRRDHGSPSTAPDYRTRQHGVVFGHYQNEIKIHRLLAVAEYGFETVSEAVVDHKNGIVWDNRPGNIEVKDPRQYTDDELIEWIDTFVQEFGFVPTASDIIGWPGPSQPTYMKRFGSFTEAIREAGYIPRGDSNE